MKKYFKLIIILLIAFSTTGCVKLNGEMKIHGTKSINFNVLFAVDTSIVDYKDNSSKIKDLKKLGYDVKEYEFNNYKGLELKYKIRNIDKVSSSKDVTYSLTSMRNELPKELFKVKKGWFKNTYKASFIFDSTDVDPMLTNDEGQDYIDYLCDDGSVITIKSGGEVKEGCHRAFKYEIENAKRDKPLSSENLNKSINKNNDLKFTVYLNKKSISNNADSVKRNVLTWNLKKSGVTNIDFEFSLFNYFHIFICLILLLILSTGIFITSKKFKKKTKKRKK